MISVNFTHVTMSECFELSDSVRMWVWYWCQAFHLHSSATSAFGASHLHAGASANLESNCCGQESSLRLESCTWVGCLCLRQSQARPHNHAVC